MPALSEICFEKGANPTPFHLTLNEGLSMWFMISIPASQRRVVAFQKEPPERQRLSVTIAKRHIALVAMPRCGSFHHLGNAAKAMNSELFLANQAVNRFHHCIGRKITAG